jgi:hypothetical protein
MSMSRAWSVSPNRLAQPSVRQIVVVRGASGRDRQFGMGREGQAVKQIGPSAEPVRRPVSNLIRVFTDDRSRSGHDGGEGSC